MNLESIIQNLRNLDTVYPPELADMRGWLAAEYAYINNQLIGVLMVKPEKWKQIVEADQVQWGSKIRHRSGATLAIHPRGITGDSLPDEAQDY